MVRLLTTSEYAGLARVHLRTVERHLSKGLIAGAFRIGREWRIPETAFPECVRAGTETMGQRRKRAKLALATVK